MNAKGLALNAERLRKRMHGGFRGGVNVEAGQGAPRRCGGDVDDVAAASFGHAPKGIPARDASTGEQKALLIGLVLAHANLVAEMTGITPLLLLDEVVAHLDPGRRRALFGEWAKLGAQVWMTGADPAAFTDVGGSGETFDVDSGHITRRRNN